MHLCSLVSFEAPLYKFSSCLRVHKKPVKMLSLFTVQPCEFSSLNLAITICLQTATKILARQLIRLRQQISKLQGSKAQMRGVATHTQVCRG